MISVLAEEYRYSCSGSGRVSSRPTTPRRPKARLVGMIESDWHGRSRMARGLTWLAWTWLLARAFTRIVRNRKRDRRTVSLQLVGPAPKADKSTKDG